MYQLAPEAGDRWRPAVTTETNTTKLFESYVQSVERTVDLITYRLMELLDEQYGKRDGQAFWEKQLASVSEFLAEQANGTIDEIAPEDHEGLVAFYQLYARACSKAAQAIDDFLDGMGTEASMREAVAALEAHNDARDCYLTSIEFPAWL